MGDIDKVLEECKYTVDEVYHTKADQQCHDGNFPHLLHQGLFRKTECSVFHTGSVPIFAESLEMPLEFLLLKSV